MTLQRVMQRGWVWLGPVMLLAGMVLPIANTSRAVLAETLAPDVDEEIVYLDGDRVIRVYEPSPPNAIRSVEWFSPSGGWGTIALGDVTGDSDMEIVAIRAEGTGGRLTIFDPVAQDSPEDQVALLESVPWAILYDITLPTAPRLVTTGEFDGVLTKREIVYSFGLDGDSDGFVILRETGAGAPGREWEEIRRWELDGRWSAIATGNVLVDDTIDEVGLVSFDRGELALYRVIPSLTLIFNNVNAANRWTNVAFGQFVLGEGDELGAVRDADLPLASAWVFRYNSATKTMVDQFAERLSPSPTVLFFGDIGTTTAANGDDELVLLRRVQQELGQRARLLVRDAAPANDTLAIGEQLLDGDNKYKGGDAGDIDGDGRDEIVVVRDNRIRIYSEPERSGTNQLIQRFTDGETVKVGNLDAAGLAQRPELFASKRSISDVLQPGQAIGATTVITLEDVTKETALPFTFSIQGAEAWATVTQSGPTTPATLSVILSAEGIAPGDYSGQIVVDAQATDVSNDPLTIDLAMTVEPVLTASPASVNFYPCDEPPSPNAQIVALSSSGAFTYTAQIEGNPEWVTVAPEAGVLPESVSVSINPDLRPEGIAFVDLLVTVDLPNEPGIINRVPIASVCPTNRLYAPLLAD